MNLAIATLILSNPGAVHVHVDGDGYLRFARGTQGVYCIDANLSVQSGLICNSDGLPLLPQMRLSTGSPFSVQMDGSVVCSGKPVGRIVLAAFAPGALQKLGKYWIASTRSQIGLPGEGVLGVIRTGAFTTPAAQAAQTTSSVASTVEVSLKSEIDKQEILLGDVATIQGPKSISEQIANVDLGATPIFGAQRGITRSYVNAAMRHAGIDVDKVTLLCPLSAYAIRKGQKVDADMLINAAKDGIKQQFGTEEDLRSNRMLPEFYVPIGQLSFTTVQAITSSDGYTVNLEVDVDGKMVTRRTIGLVSTNPAAKVQAGDPVKIRVIKNGASVEVDGKTRVSGKVGSTISVQSDAGATFTGTLVSTSLVEVKL
jgi:hypothetical protein